MAQWLAELRDRAKIQIHGDRIPETPAEEEVEEEKVNEEDSQDSEGRSAGFRRKHDAGGGKRVTRIRVPHCSNHLFFLPQVDRRGGFCRSRVLTIP